MKIKFKQILCDEIGNIAIGVGIISTGLACGILGFLLGKYDC